MIKPKRNRFFELYKITTLLFCVVFYLNSFGQPVFYQDMCNCGVTAAGFSTGLGTGSGTFDIYIESGSTIKKAYIFTYRIGSSPPATFLLNGSSYIFDTTKVITKVNHLNSYASPIRFYYLDVTQDISPNTLNYTITIPDQLGLPINWGYWTFFLYVVYENPLLPETSYTIIANNQNLYGNSYYSINQLNPILNSFPVGFSIYTDRMGGAWGNILNNVYFNSNSLGTCGGNDNVNNLWIASGVKGHFYYQNNQLFGLDDDTPDAVMGGADGLADVSSYLSNNATSCNFQLTHINYPNQSEISTSAYLAYFLTYTSPCSPFDVSVPNDTTICQGSALQLNVSGGQSYEWLAPINSTTGNPAPGLSCTNCPNPVFSADSSMFYTVRIWNNDSCSVVRPVHITVKEPPVLPQLSTLKAQCGVASGSITIKTPKETGELYILSANGDTLVKPIVANQNTNQGGLYAGNYTVYFQDALGCVSSDTVITIGSVNNTVASFTVTPQSGGAPLNVAINNTSQNAQQYNWYLNGVLQSNPFTGFLAPTSGSYEVMLVAWKNDVLCADTATTTVLVYDSLIVSLPNVFTPNGDGVNEYFSIQTNLPVKADVIIFNRWGNEVFSYSGNLAVGMNLLWDAKDVIDGVYFYKIDVLIDENEIDCHQNCKVSKEGFITVVR